MDRSPQQRPKLGVENIRGRQAEPDGPPAEQGVGLADGEQVGNQFVAPQIEGPDRDAAAAHAFQNPPVGLVLDVFADAHAVLDEQKFRPVQADSLAAVGQDRIHFFRNLNVGFQTDLAAVEGFGRQGVEAFEPQFLLAVRACLAR